MIFLSRLLRQLNPQSKKSQLAIDGAAVVDFRTMQDPRKIRQTLQTLLALAMIVSPVALAVPFDWRALVVATLGGIMAILTNPRLVTGLAGVMPDAGSSAVKPPLAAGVPVAPMETGDAPAKVLPIQADKP
jgi:hypothetical protein